MSPEPERPRRPVGLAALGGFVLGAATVLLIVWFYGAGRHVPVAPAPPTVPAPVPAPRAPAAGATVPLHPPPAAPGPEASSADLADLARRRLLLPVAGVRPESLTNTYDDGRSGGRVHHAIDIPAPRNTPVLAVEDGAVAKLFTSKLGGITVYEFDPTTTYSYYYAHLERYADGLKEGDRVRRGQVLGYVGTSGDAPPDAPHLHFEITRLGPERHWWQGTPINPFVVLRGEAAGGAPAGR